MDLPEESEQDKMNDCRDHRLATVAHDCKAPDICNSPVLHPNGLRGQKEDFSNLVNHLRPGTRTKTSMVWNFFHIDPQFACRATCNLCRKSVSRGKRVSQLGTSTLQRHLQARHPADWAEGQNSVKPVTKGVDRSVLLFDFISHEDKVCSIEGQRDAYKINMSQRDCKAPVSVHSVSSFGNISDGDLNLYASDKLKNSKVWDHELTVESPSPPQSRDKTMDSPVWALFHIVRSRPSQATCVICRETVGREKRRNQIGVATLENHLQTKHPSQWATVYSSVSKNCDPLLLDSQIDALMGMSETKTVEEHRSSCAETNYKTNRNTSDVDTLLVPQVLGRKRKVVSPVWVFFNRDPQHPSHAICRLCNKSVSRGRPGTQLGTSTLQRHLLAKHPEPWECLNNQHLNIRDLVGKPLSLFLSQTTSVSSNRSTQAKRTKRKQHPSCFIKKSSTCEKQTPLNRTRITRPGRVKRSTVLAARNNSPSKNHLHSKKSPRGKRLRVSSRPLTTQSVLQNEDRALGKPAKVLHKRVKRVASPVWKLFYKDPFYSSHAVCIVCNRSVSRGKPGTQLGTSTLQRHLLAKHPLHWSTVQDLD